MTYADGRAAKTGTWKDDSIMADKYRKFVPTDDWQFVEDGEPPTPS